MDSRIAKCLCVVNDYEVAILLNAPFGSSRRAIGSRVTRLSDGRIVQEVGLATPTDWRAALEWALEVGVERVRQELAQTNRA
jgi:hypothetical protein